MAKLTKINHVAVVVSDIDEALKFWQDGLGTGLIMATPPLRHPA